MMPSGCFIGTVRGHGHRHPLTVGGAVHPVVHADRSPRWRSLAAEDAPRASMISAPRLPYARDVLIRDPRLVTDRVPVRARPSTLALKRSGYMVGEWLPQIAMLVISETGGAGLLRELGDRPVVVEPGHRGEAPPGRRGGEFRSGRWCSPGCRTRARMSSAASSLIARPGARRCRRWLEQIGALHARRTWSRPTSSAMSAPSNAARRRRSVDSSSSGNAESNSSSPVPSAPSPHGTRAAAGGPARRAEQVPGGDPEEQGIADLPTRRLNGDGGGHPSRLCHD